MIKYFQLKDFNNDDVGLLRVWIANNQAEVNEDLIQEIFTENYNLNWDDTDELFDSIHKDLLEIGLESERIYVEDLYA